MHQWKWAASKEEITRLCMKLHPHIIMVSNWFQLVNLGLSVTLHHGHDQWLMSGTGVRKYI